GRRWTALFSGTAPRPRSRRQALTRTLDGWTGKPRIRTSQATIRLLLGVGGPGRSPSRTYHSLHSQRNVAMSSDRIRGVAGKWSGGPRPRDGARDPPERSLLGDLHQGHRVDQAVGQDEIALSGDRGIAHDVAPAGDGPALELLRLGVEAHDRIRR